MLAEYIYALNSQLAQLENGLGVPIPRVSKARELLAVAIGSTDPVTLEQRLEIVEFAVNDIADGTQPAPNSILANLLTAIEQHRQMRQRIVEGRQVVWAREPVSIDGTIHEVFTGAWPAPTTGEIAERIKTTPKRAGRPRSKK